MSSSTKTGSTTGVSAVAILQAAVGGLVVVQRRGEAAFRERGAQDGAILGELSVHAVAHDKYNQANTPPLLDIPPLPSACPPR